jgi:hypothetical protein
MLFQGCRTQGWILIVTGYSGTRIHLPKPEALLTLEVTAGWVQRRFWNLWHLIGGTL